MSVEESHKSCCLSNFSFTGPLRGSQPSTMLNPGPLTAHTGRLKKGAVGHKSESGDAARDATASH